MPGAIRRAEPLSAAPHLEAARLILEIDISKLLAVAVAHDKAGGLFVNEPRRREAAGCHQNHNATSSATRKVTTATTLGLKMTARNPEVG
jgi:hypothetical protein